MMDKRIGRFILILTLLPFLSLILIGQPSKSKGPIIEFKQKVINYGKVRAGEVLHLEFEFKNSGDSTLHIHSVSVSCGCTTAGQWPHEVAPGATGKIPIEFRTEGYSGHLTRSITVISDAVNEPTVHLQLTGEIWQPIVLSPTLAYMSMVEGFDQLPKAVVKLQNNLDEPLKIKTVTADVDLLNISYKETVKGKTFEFEIQPKKPLPTGIYTNVIRINTDSHHAPQIELKALIHVVEKVTVVPTQIFLQPGPLPENYVRYVSIRANQPGERLKITKTEVIGIENVNVFVQSFGGAHQYQIRLSFPPGLLLKTDQKAELRIYTDYPGYEIIRLPIVQPQREPFQ